MSLQPTLAEVLAAAMDSRLADVHTSVPGKIKSYDAATQKAEVEITVNRVELNSQGAAVYEEYPVLPNVPVAWPRGGGYSMQFPLDVGDHVLLVFGESDSSRWRTSGEVGNPGEVQRHTLSYAYAIPCIAPDDDTLPDGSAEALVTVPSGGHLSVRTDGGTADWVPLDGLLQDELTRLWNNINTLKSACSANASAADAAQTTANAGGPPVTTASVAFTSATASIPTTPNATQCTTLKAE